MIKNDSIKLKNHNFHNLIIINIFRDSQDPNSLRLLVRDTTSSSKRKDIPVSKTSDDTDVYPSGYGEPFTLNFQYMKHDGNI